MKLKRIIKDIRLWHFGVFFIGIGFTLMGMKIFDVILSIQGEISVSLIALSYGIGFILVFIQMMIDTTAFIRIVSTFCFVFLMFFVANSIFRVSYIAVKNDDLHVIIETTKDSPSSTDERLYTYTFYDYETDFYSRKTGTGLGSGYYYVIEDNQLKVYQFGVVGPVKVIPLD